MSMPVTTFYCTECDYRQGDSESWGSRAYVLPDGSELQVPRRLGWCEDCGGLASVETFSAVDLANDIRLAKQELADLPPQPVRQPWQVVKYLPFSGWDTKVRRWNFKQSDIPKRIDEATTLLSIVEKRKNPPRCLECGSARVIAPIVPNREFWDAEKPKATGFKHPGCGGELWADKDGFRVSIRPSIRRYTPEGDFIERVFHD